MVAPVSHLQILVEEAATEAALRLLLPRIVGAEVTWSIYSHRGKQHLLRVLDGRLKALSQWLPDDHRVVVLVDLDMGDCRELRGTLDEIALRAGFSIWSGSSGARCCVMNRIAIEELEAWFFGDMEALRTAYPRLPENLPRRATFRNPDAIKGGTWEALERVLQSTGYHEGGLPKILNARSVAAHMDPDRNRSRSFQVFRDGLRAMVLP